MIMLQLFSFHGSFYSVNHQKHKKTQNTVMKNKNRIRNYPSTCCEYKREKMDSIFQNGARAGVWVCCCWFTHWQVYSG